MKKTSAILLFDGICNLCSGTVQFVLKRDRDEKFTFASLQSEAGQRLLKKYNLPISDFQSFVLIDENQIYLQSTAALRIAKSLNFPYSWLWILIVVPEQIRDFFYRIIAKNRYRWFGKKEQCWLPNAELQNRFL